MRRKLLLLLGAVALVSGLTARPSSAAFCTDLTYCHEQDAICQANCTGLTGPAYSSCVSACIKAYMRCYSSC
jgi:hypothetical protein